jgi:hypothetical protein
MKASEAQQEAKNLLKDVVRAVGWTETREVGWGSKKKKKEYLLSDNAGHPMDDIKTGYRKSGGWASITSPSRDGKSIKLQVNTDWWEEATAEEQLGLICHEAAHLKVHSGNGAAHRPEFWEVNKLVYKEVATHDDFQDYDWDKVAEFAEEDPNSNCVDRRSETVEERKEKMAEVRHYR